MNLRKIDQLDLANKKVLVRLDLNVPMEDGKIRDDTRIRAALPTIRHILEQTNQVVLMSHLGRPGGKEVPSMSLEAVGGRLAELLDRQVLFVQDYHQEPVEQMLASLDSNQLILLENLRFHGEETKNDREFSRMLSRGFDVFINDAFGTLHRAHASTVGVAECMKPEQRAAGLLVVKEIECLSRVASAPEAPFTVIMGGSKVSDKIGVTLNLLNHCNHLLIGGAMAYTFLKYRGIDVGDSRVEEDKLDLVESIYRNAETRRVEIHIPEDHVAAASFDKGADPVVVEAAAIPTGLMGLDIGPRTLEKYQKVIAGSRTVLWNGPMGVFEWDAFAGGTLGVARAMAECPGYSLIGGGDSVAAANKAGVAGKMSHISTGGGASLEYLEGKVLPGVKVLMQS